MIEHNVMKMTADEIQSSFDKLMHSASKALFNHPYEATPVHGQYKRVSILKDSRISHYANTNIKEGM
ncbi:MAG: hypothetical protein R8M45_09600 [Ghiorsea sp.]